MRRPPEYKDEPLEAGFFPIPHYIRQVCDNIHDLAFLCSLAKCENRWAGTQEGWFYIGDVRLATMCMMSRDKLTDCRKRLNRRGLFEYRKGSSHSQTQYRLTWASAKLKSEA